MHVCIDGHCLSEAKLCTSSGLQVSSCALVMADPREMVRTRWDPCAPVGTVSKLCRISLLLEHSFRPGSSFKRVVATSHRLAVGAQIHRSPGLPIDESAEQAICGGTFCNSAPSILMMAPTLPPVPSGEPFPSPPDITQEYARFRIWRTLGAGQWNACARGCV